MRDVKKAVQAAALEAVLGPLCGRRIRTLQRRCASASRVSRGSTRSFAGRNNSLELLLPFTTEKCSAVVLAQFEIRFQDLERPLHPHRDVLSHRLGGLVRPPVGQGFRELLMTTSRIGR